MSHQGAIKVDTNQNATQGSFRIEVKQVAEAAIANTKTITDKNNQKLTKDSKVSDIKGMYGEADIDKSKTLVN